MSKVPKDDILESMYNTELNDSEQLKNTFALCNQDTVQQNESTRYTRLKNMVKRYLDQITQDRNFDARNDRTASGASIRRKADERSKNNDGKTGWCRQ